MVERVGRVFRRNFYVGQICYAFRVERPCSKSGDYIIVPPMRVLLGANSMECSDKSKVTNFTPVEDGADKSKVGVLGYYFSDSKSEAISKFNELLNKEIKFHEDKIEKIRSYIRSYE